MPITGVPLQKDTFFPMGKKAIATDLPPPYVQHTHDILMTWQDGASPPAQRKPSSEFLCNGHPHVYYAEETDSNGRNLYLTRFEAHKCLPLSGYPRCPRLDHGGAHIVAPRVKESVRNHK